VYDSQHALIRAPLASSGETRSLAMFATAGILSIGSVLVGLPLVSLGIVTLIATFGFVFGIRSLIRSSRVEPYPVEAIASLEARETYRAILSAYAELARAIVDAPRLTATRWPVLERCAASVRLCGRLARSCDPLQRYLDAHDPIVIDLELGRLRARAESATDARAVTTFHRAASARSEELATRARIAAIRERIQARLELVRASFESFTGRIVSLEMLGNEDIVAASEGIAEQLSDTADELEVVEATLADFAA